MRRKGAIKGLDTSIAASPNRMALRILVSALLIFEAYAGAGGGDGVGGATKVSTDQPPEFELDRIRSTISSLESRISYSAQELKTKQESIENLERMMQEKADTIITLQQKIESLQGSVDAQKAAGKGNKSPFELEKQVEKLKIEIETQNKKRDALEIRISESERKVHEMNLKLENLLKTIGEQKQRIQKTEHALEVAEERLAKARLEMTSKSRRLDKTHESWLPPWLEKHLIVIQEFISSGWNENAKFGLSGLIEKEWIPAIKEHIMIAKGSAGPHVEKIGTKAVKAYKVAKKNIKAYVLKMQGLCSPYFQEILKFCKPYLDKLQVIMKPYKRQILRAYRRIHKWATKYHMQVQTTVQEKLKLHEATTPLATKEFAWITASALFIVPLFFAFRLISVLVCKRTRRRRKNGHANSGNRRSRRRHSEKKDL